MLAIDFIGLAMTICLVGLRYPHYVLAAAAIHDVGRVITALFLSGHIQSVVAAGAFGAASVTELGSPLKGALVVLGGPLACYLASATAGGIEHERTARLINPCAVLDSPFVIITLRLAIISFLANICQLF